MYIRDYSTQLLSGLVIQIMNWHICGTVTSTLSCIHPGSRFKTHCCRVPLMFHSPNPSSLHPSYVSHSTKGTSDVLLTESELSRVRLWIVVSVSLIFEMMSTSDILGGDR